MPTKKLQMLGYKIVPPEHIGKSAYEIAVDHGFEGTEEEWLEYLATLKVRTVSDLNDATTPGFYEIKGSDILNYPTDNHWFAQNIATLIVKTNGETIYQTITAKNVSAKRWYNKTSKKWAEWEYVNPPYKQDIEYPTTDRIIDERVYKRYNSTNDRLEYRCESETEWSTYSDLIGAAPAGYGLGGAAKKIEFEHDPSLDDMFGDDPEWFWPDVYGALNKTVANGWYCFDIDIESGFWNIDAKHWCMRVTNYDDGSDSCIQEIYPIAPGEHRKIIRRKYAGEWLTDEVSNIPESTPVTDWNKATVNGFYKNDSETTNENSPFTGHAACGYTVVNTLLNEPFATQVAFAQLTVDNRKGLYQKIRSLDDAGNWGEWEWVNPPYDFDVEYRTTERYLGRPVYTKMIYIGKLPDANTEVSKAVSTPNKGALVRHVFVSGGTHAAVDRYITGFEFYTDSILFKHNRADLVNDNIQVYLIVHYTKTTD